MAVIHLCGCTAPVTSTRGAAPLPRDIRPALAALSFTLPQLYLFDGIYEIWNSLGLTLIIKHQKKKIVEEAEGPNKQKF